MAKENTATDVGIFNDEVPTKEFFESLDEDPTQATPADADDKDKKAVSDSDAVRDDIEARLKKVEERYGASSSEAIKLRQQLNELEPFVPIIEEMKSDPSLVQKVREHIESKDEHKDPVEALGLDEDFVFDFDEAIKDPNSDSAKVMDYFFERKARMIEARRQQQAEIQRQEELKKQFINERKLSDEQAEKLDAFVKKHQLTYDDVFYLMNRGENEKSAAKKAQEALIKQLKAVRNMNGDVLGGIASTPVDTSDDDAFFNELFGTKSAGLFE